MSHQTHGLGKAVAVLGLTPGVKTVVRFVAAEEVNYKQHRVPTDSLLARALIGANPGDRVTLNPSHDPRELTVLEWGAV